MTLPSLILLSTMTVTATSYRAVSSQTDSTPLYTSIDQHVHTYGIAVSRDLLTSQMACYGDVIAVPGYGLRVVNDTMNVRNRNAVDLFVETRTEEHKFGTRTLTITIIKSETRKCSRDEYFGKRSDKKF